MNENILAKLKIAAISPNVTSTKDECIYRYIHKKYIRSNILQIGVNFDIINFGLFKFCIFNVETVGNIRFMNDASAFEGANLISVFLDMDDYPVRGIQNTKDSYLNKSLDDVKSRLSRHAISAPVVLIGVIRDNIQPIIPYNDVREKAISYGMVDYFQCNPVTGEGIDEAFEKSFRIAIAHSGKQTVTNLFLAVKAEHLETLPLFMQTYGLSINIKNAEGLTLVHAAAQAGQYDVLAWLLENGANSHTPDNQGNTPLHLAVQQALQAPEVLEKHTQIIALLLKQGAKPDSKNQQGQAALSDNDKPKLGFDQPESMLAVYEAQQKAEAALDNFEQTFFDHMTLGSQPLVKLLNDMSEQKMDASKQTVLEEQLDKESDALLQDAEETSVAELRIDKMEAKRAVNTFLSHLNQNLNPLAENIRILKNNFEKLANKLNQEHTDKKAINKKLVEITEILAPLEKRYQEKKQIRAQVELIKQSAQQRIFYTHTQRLLTQFMLTLFVVSHESNIKVTASYASTATGISATQTAVGITKAVADKTGKVCEYAGKAVGWISQLIKVSAVPTLNILNKAGDVVEKLHLPVISAVAGLAAQGLQEISDTVEKKKIERLIELITNLDEIKQLAEITARRLTREYEQSINQLTTKGTKTLAKSAVRRIIAGLFRNLPSNENADKTNDEIVKSWIGLIIEEDANKAELDLWVKKIEIPFFAKKEVDRLAEDAKGKPLKWYEDDVFKKPGIAYRSGANLVILHEGEAFKYGYRVFDTLAEANEAKNALIRLKLISAEPHQVLILPLAEESNSSSQIAQASIEDNKLLAKIGALDSQFKTLKTTVHLNLFGEPQRTQIISEINEQIEAKVAALEQKLSEKQQLKEANGFYAKGKSALILKNKSDAITFFQQAKDCYKDIQNASNLLDEKAKQRVAKRLEKLKQPSGEYSIEKLSKLS